MLLLGALQLVFAAPEEDLLDVSGGLEIGEHEVVVPSPTVRVRVSEEHEHGRVEVLVGRHGHPEEDEPQHGSGFRWLDFPGLSVDK